MTPSPVDATSLPTTSKTVAVRHGLVGIKGPMPCQG